MQEILRAHIEKIIPLTDEEFSLIHRFFTTVTFKNYKAGKYFLRITYDTNKNGIWDTGNVLKRLQPEKVWNEPKEMSIRANWERNETITIPKE